MPYIISRPHLVLESHPLGLIFHLVLESYLLGLIFHSYLSAVTEFITGRDIDTCPSDGNAGTSGYSTGQALNEMGVARMDIYDSEIACETAGPRCLKRSLFVCFS